MEGGDLSSLLYSRSIGFVKKNLRAKFLKFPVGHSVIHMTMSIQHPPNLFSGAAALLHVGDSSFEFRLQSWIYNSDPFRTTVDHVRQVRKPVLPYKVDFGGNLHRHNTGRSVPV